MFGFLIFKKKFKIKKKKKIKKTKKGSKVKKKIIKTHQFL
jgi:hypothetical protein